MDELFTRFLRIGTTMFWGALLLIPAWAVSSKADPDSPFYERHLFGLALLSLASAITLAVRVHLRRHRV